MSHWNMSHWKWIKVESGAAAEPYSIAMLLREHFPELDRGLPARLLVKHFRKQQAAWQLTDDIRRMVDFQRINLSDAWPALPPQDVVFVRNVLIYFDVATKKRLLAKVRRVLRPDGCLFLGGGETTLNLDPRFERRPYDRGCCYGLMSGEVSGQ